MTAVERTQVGLLRAVGGRMSSILQIAETMQRSREAVRKALASEEAQAAMRAARQVLEKAAEGFAYDWVLASQIAALDGNHKPARDALAALNVVDKVVLPTAPNITLNVPFVVSGFTPTPPQTVEADATTIDVQPALPPADQE